MEPREYLLNNLDSVNMAEDIDNNELNKIGQRVINEYEIDDESRSDWLKNTEKAMELANQIPKEKSYPWPNAANVKYPLITSAAIQFNARAYPAIVSGNSIVKCEVIGNDQDNVKAERAERISEHMSYQLMHEMEEWEPDQDRQLIVLPIVGTDFKKSYFDKVLGRNVSYRVSAKDLVVNNKAKSLETAPRVTEVFTLYPYQITEKKRTGEYLDIEYPSSNSEDEYEPIEFLEQHRVIDLDEDGYPEPYIVTVHKETGMVARIVPCYDESGVIFTDESKTLRFTLEELSQIEIDIPLTVVKIESEQYYTKYGFMPDPEGGFYDIGLGILLNPINESINTTLNQLLDAGHLANTGGGFIGRGMRMKRGEIRFRPGEYKQVDVSGDNVRNNIVPLQFPGPNVVLFQLLGLLVDAARELSNVNEVMAGDGQMAMAQPTTVMALIEQGQMVFSAVHKRIYRSLSKELKLLYKLNSLYLEDEEYFRVMDTPKAVGRRDYADDLDVKPVSDPNMATNQQKLAKANFLMQFSNDPYMNPMEIRKRVLEAANIEDIENLLQAPEQGPDIQLMVKVAELENREAELDNETREINSQIIKNISQAALNLEKAEAENAGIQLQYYQTMLQEMVRGLNDRARVQRMEGEPGDTMGVSGAIDGQASPDGVMGAGPRAAGVAGPMPGI